MMRRGNLRIRQSLHLSHFLTSAGLGFAETDSMFKDMHVRRIITSRLEKLVLYFSSSL
jgi:hypothetical protein